MDLKTYGRGTVIFRQGDPGDCMYEIQGGSVGVYVDYGGPNEKKIAHLAAPDFLGEMGLLDHAPRSATAVSMEDSTVLEVISEADFNTFFFENPSRVLMLMEQLCFRLRNTTREYLDACRTVYETAEADKSGKPKSRFLLSSIRKFSDIYKGFGTDTRG